MEIKINDEDKHIAELFYDDKAIIIVNKIDLLDKLKEINTVRVEMTNINRAINKSSSNKIFSRSPHVLMSAGI